MIVVSDTSPLIVLAKLHMLDHLRTMFGSVLIPLEVREELAAKGEVQGAPDVLSQCGEWMVVKTPGTLLELTGLDAGEIAAISLALDVKAGFLMIDERDGRKIAQSLGLQIIGVVGLLESFARRGLVSLAEAFQELKNTNFRFPASQLDSRLEEFNRRRNSTSTS